MINKAKKSEEMSIRKQEIKFGLIGSSGKMGKEIINSATRENAFLIPYFRSEPKFELKFEPEYSIEAIFEKSDVIINFSHEIYYSLSTKYLKPMLLGSTGHEESDLPVNPPFAFMYAPNVLIEWGILKTAAEKIATFGNFTISIDDIHHPAKKDAPSGTAKELAFAKEADIRSIRRPMISSWHQISFFDENQVIKLEHQVFHRSAYADSSLKIAEWLSGKEARKYDMQDFISSFF